MLCCAVLWRGNCFACGFLRCVNLVVVLVRRDNTLHFEVGGYALFSFVCAFRRFVIISIVLFGECTFWAFLSCAVPCCAEPCCAVLGCAVL